MVVGLIYTAPKTSWPELSTKDKIRKMDIVGSLFLISTIICLLLVLQWAGVKYAWNDPRVWGCLLGFGCLLCIFIFVQIRKKEE